MTVSSFIHRRSPSSAGTCLAVEFYTALVFHEVFRTQGRHPDPC